MNNFNQLPSSELSFSHSAGISLESLIHSIDVVPPTDPVSTTPESIPTTNTGVVVGDTYCMDGTIIPIGDPLPTDCGVESTTTTVVIVDTGIPPVPPDTTLCADGIRYVNIQLPENCLVPPTTEAAPADTTTTTIVVPATTIAPIALVASKPKETSLPVTGTGEIIGTEILFATALVALGGVMHLRSRRPSQV
ncbi:hypothetical protein H0V99_02290 [Candidatus Saccharibacteria bacterium]|nr:hypothetical protein [Candidatus Saccharibacteria bacterium]